MLECTKRKSNEILVVVFAFVLFFGFGFEVKADFSSSSNDDTWVTDGRVYTVTSTEDTVYIGGRFSQVGPNTGPGVPVSTTTGDAVNTFPKVNDGYIRAVISDGAGGWYIGGSFRRVGPTSRNRLAHILPDGTLDLDWNPNVNNDVYSLTLDPSNSLLYIGGNFTSVGGQSRNRVAAVSISTGAPTSWNPSAGGIVESLVLNSDSSLIYIGGNFASVGGQSRNRIAAVSTSTGAATSWNPNVSNNYVYAIALSPDENTVYAGGTFNTVGGLTRNRLVAIDASTGVPTAWNPNANGNVNDIEINSSGNTIYAGGSFTTVGGQWRDSLVAIDSSTGAPTSWTSDAALNVREIILNSDESLLYAGGDFTSIGGKDIENVAAVSTVTGIASDWDPKVGSTSVGPSLALSPDDSTIYIGGYFFSVGVQDRLSVAAIDASTGLATSWNPNAGTNSDVYALTLNSDNSIIYIGGQISNVGGQTRRGIAAVETSSGSVTSWNANLTEPISDVVSVRSIALSPDDSVVYMGGYFPFAGGQSRNNLASVLASNGAVTSWNPNPNGNIKSLAATSDGSIVYVAGSFTSIGGESRDYLGAISTSTGLATSWDANSNGFISKIVLNSDNSLLYTGGSFTSIGGNFRSRIAAIETSTGTSTSWNPRANNSVIDISLSPDETTFYAVGSFTTMGGIYTRNYAASVLTATGAVTSWNPNPDSSNVDCVNLSPSGSKIYLSGYFFHIGSVYQPYFAQFSELPDYTLTYSAGAGGSISGDSPQIVPQGSSGTAVSAVPDIGYHFIDWSDGSTQNPRTDTSVMGDVSVTANFSNMYSLSYTAGSNGSISGSTTQSVIYGGDGTEVIAIPDSGYHFTSWSDGVLTSARTDINIDDNIDVTANFAINTYELTLQNYSANQNSGAVQIDFYNSQTIPSSGKVEITIPDEFIADNIADLTSNITSFIEDGSDINISSATLNNRVISIVIGEEINSSSNIVINFDDTVIDTNPLISSNYDFSINTYDESSVLLESGLATVDINSCFNTISLGETKLVSLSSACDSVHRSGRYAKYYTFTLTASTTLNIDISTSDLSDIDDTYIYLLSGMGSGGTVLAQDDDGGSGYFSRITFGELAAGSYTIEATTYSSGIEGDFNLSLDGVIPGILTNTDITLENYIKSESSGASQIIFTNETSIPVLGSVIIDIPSEFNTDDIGDLLSNITSFTANGSDISISSSEVLGNVISIDVGGVISADSNMIIDFDNSVIDTNPVNVGSYSFDIQTYDDASNLLDEGTASVEILDNITTFTLTYTADSNGIISGDSSQTINDGEDGEEVIAVPNPGYHFVDWSDGLTDNPRTDTNVTGDISVTANFAMDTANSHTLTYTAGENGSLTGNLSQTIEEGEDGTAVTAVPNSGYEFTNWSDGLTENPRTDANVTKNVSVVANFDLINDEEEDEEDPEAKAKDLEESCSSITFKVSTDFDDEELDFKVELENLDTGEKSTLKFNDIETNSSGRAKLTLESLFENTNYKIKVKYKDPDTDEYTDWSSSKEIKTSFCEVPVVTEEIPEEEFPGALPVKERDDSDDKKEEKKEKKKESEENKPTTIKKEEKSSGFGKAAAKAAAVAGGGGLVGSAWIGRRRLAMLFGFTWMKKRNWRVFDVETGDAIEGAMVSLESPGGEILEEETTDNKGHFKFKASPGNNTIKVDKEGYQMIEQQEKEIIEEYGEIYTGGSLNNNRDVSLNINIPMRKIKRAI